VSRPGPTAGRSLVPEGFTVSCEDDGPLVPETRDHRAARAELIDAYCAEVSRVIRACNLRRPPGLREVRVLTVPRFLFVLAIAGVSLHSLSAQSGSRPPVIDMHVHSTTTRPLDLARLASLNVRYVFLAGLQPDLAMWSTVDPARYLPALIFPCASGRAPITGRPCFATTSELPDLEWLRGALRAGRVKAFGELEPQFLGMSPDDERLEPYWQLAEEFDIPVGIHMGPGPPGAAYDSSPAPFKSPRFPYGSRRRVAARRRASSPQTASPFRDAARFLRLSASVCAP